MDEFNGKVPYQILKAVSDPKNGFKALPFQA